MNKSQERYQNMFSLFRTLRLEGTLTQSELKDRLHLQASTISYLVNDLKREGLLQLSSLENSAAKGKVGKPGQYLEIANEHAYFLGLYLEETFIDLHVIGLADQEVHFQHIPLENPTPQELIQKVISLIGHFTTVYENIKGVGLAVKSVVDKDGNLSSFKRTINDREVPRIWKVEGFTASIRAAFPNLEIVVENDANCAAVYCQTASKQETASSMVFIINQKPFGIGSGIIIDGKLFKGCNGASGEIFFSDRNIQNLVEQNSLHQDPVQLIRLLAESILKALYLIDPQFVTLTGGLLSDLSSQSIASIKAVFKDAPYPIEVISQEHLSLPAKGAVLLVADTYISTVLSGIERR